MIPRVVVHLLVHAARIICGDHIGHRLAKRDPVFSGLVFTASGKLQSVELYGPGDFETWEQSWRVYCAGCILLAQVLVSTLDAYRDLMFHYSRNTRLMSGHVWSSWNV